jgi:hypothetical protein
MPELMRRYVVMAMATEAPFDLRDPEGVFVLKPWKDPAALRALAAYRDNCYPELSGDLDVWIRTIETGPQIRGDVGRRNEPHVKSVRAKSPSAGRSAARTASGVSRKSATRPSSASRKRPAGTSGGRRRTSTKRPKKRGR